MFTEYFILKLDDIIFYSVILTIIFLLIVIVNILLTLTTFWNYDELQIKTDEDKLKQKELTEKVKKSIKRLVISLIIFLVVLLIPILLPSTKEMREILKSQSNK